MVQKEASVRVALLYYYARGAGMDGFSKVLPHCLSAASVAGQLLLESCPQPLAFQLLPPTGNPVLWVFSQVIEQELQDLMKKSTFKKTSQSVYIISSIFHREGGLRRPPSISWPQRTCFSLRKCTA